MTEWSAPFTNGLTDGGPVSQASLWRIFRMLLGNAAEEADKGVIRGWDNELAATSPGADQVAIDTGAAFVHGTPYENDATVTLTATRPSVNTTGKRVVLRKDIAAGGVRLTVISSADGTATLPALTQSTSTYWEIPVCSFTHATNGTIAALTDEREFLDVGGAMKATTGTGEVRVPAGPNSGTTVTSGAANNYGSYVEFIAAAPGDLLITKIHFTPPGSAVSYQQAQIARGAAASEVVAGTFHAKSAQNSAGVIGPGNVLIDPPIFVAAGTRVAVRIADSVGAIGNEIAISYVLVSDLRGV